MGIESHRNELRDEKEWPDLPFLAKSKSKTGSEFIIFVSSKSAQALQGVVVNTSSGSKYPLGDDSKAWKADEFEPYYGSVEIKQTR